MTMTIWLWLQDYDYIYALSTMTTGYRYIHIVLAIKSCVVACCKAAYEAAKRSVLLGYFFWL